MFSCFIFATLLAGQSSQGWQNHYLRLLESRYSHVHLELVGSHWWGWNFSVRGVQHMLLSHNPTTKAVTSGRGSYSRIHCGESNVVSLNILNRVVGSMFSPTNTCRASKLGTSRKAFQTALGKGQKRH